jgi:hypothetical protein
MGLQIVPQGLGGGTVTITGAGVPATGSPWKAPASSGPTVETFANGPVNGSATYYAFEISEIDVGAVGRILPGETVSLAAIVIQSSEDAAGLWNLWAVSESDEFGAVTTEYIEPSFDAHAFGNLEAAAYPDPGNAFALHGIQYVPEPATGLAGLGVATVAAAALVRRGRGPRRRPAAATGRRRPPP